MYIYVYVGIYTSGRTNSTQLCWKKKRKCKRYQRNVRLSCAENLKKKSITPYRKRVLKLK